MKIFNVINILKFVCVFYRTVFESDKYNSSTLIIHTQN